VFTIPGEGENGKFRADQGAEFAIHALFIFPVSNHRDAVAFFIPVFRDAQNILWAELNTDLAAFTTFRDQINLAAGNDYLGDIQRGARENPHNKILYTTCIPPELASCERASRT
jgi:hypothetical protein